LPKIILNWTGPEVGVEVRQQVQSWVEGFEAGKLSEPSEYDRVPLGQVYLNAQPLYFDPDPSFIQIMPALTNRLQHPPVQFSNRSIIFSVGEEITLDAFDAARAVWGDLVFYRNLYAFGLVSVHFSLIIPNLAQELNAHRCYRYLKGIFWGIREFQFEQLPVEIQLSFQPNHPVNVQIEAEIEPGVIEPDMIEPGMIEPGQIEIGPTATSQSIPGDSFSEGISDHSEIYLGLIGRTLPEFSAGFFDPYLKSTRAKLGGFPPEVSSEQLNQVIRFKNQFSARILAFEPVNRDCLLSALISFCMRERLSLITNPARDWQIAHLTAIEYLLSFSRYRLLVAISPLDWTEIQDYCQAQSLECQLISTKLRSRLNHFFIAGFVDCGLDQMQAWVNHEVHT
jgi:hypothetical protein